MRVSISLFSARAARLAGLMAFLAVGPLAGAQSRYSVNIDTSTLAATSGYVDFLFGTGGADALDATATISSFSTDGALASTATNFGTPTTPLPQTVALDNGVATGNANEELFQGITFGSQIGFKVDFTGPALTPGGAPPSFGSRLAVALYAGDGTTPLLTNNPNGDALLYLDLNPDGSTTATPFQDAGGIGRVSAATPEPGALSLLIGGLAAAACLRKRGVSRRQA